MMINKLDSIERIAGVDTVEAEVSPEESIKVLKEAVQIYYDFLTGRTNICDIDFFKKLRLSMTGGQSGLEQRD